MVALYGRNTPSVKMMNFIEVQAFKPLHGMTQNTQDTRFVFRGRVVRNTQNKLALPDPVWILLPYLAWNFLSF